MKNTNVHIEKKEVKLCQHKQCYDLLSPYNPGNTWYTKDCKRVAVEGTEFCSDHQPPK